MACERVFMEFHKGWQKYKGNYYTQKMVCNIKGNGHNIMWPVFFLVKINCFIKALICVNKILGQYQGTIIYFIEILLTKCNSNIHGTVK